MHDCQYRGSTWPRSAEAPLAASAGRRRPAWPRGQPRPSEVALHLLDGFNIVETLDEHVCLFFMREWDDAATLGAELPPSDDGAAHRRRSRMALEDGTVVGSIFNAFLEEQDGFTARHSVTLPVTCGPEVIEHHLEHFAIELHNWALTAGAPPQAEHAARPPRTLATSRPPEGC